MIDEYLIYSLVFTGSLLLAVIIIGIRRLTSLTRLGGLYLLIFTATYLGRPLLTNLTGDFWQLTYMRIAGLDRTLTPMSIAVFLAIICFALGYRLPLRRLVKGKKSQEVLLPSTKHHESIYFLCGVLLLWGYLSMVMVQPVIGIRGEDIPMEVTDQGSMYTQTTGYITQGNLYVAVAAVLLYAVSGKFFVSILVAAPWLLNRLYIGWGRANYLAFVLAMIMVWAIRQRQKMVPRIQGLFLLGMLTLAIVSLSIIGSNRYYFRERGVSIAAFAEGSRTAGSDLIRATSFVSGFEATLYLLQLVPDTYPFGYGGMYVYRYLVQPIPRILWPEKPMPFGFPGGDAQEFYGAAPGSIGEAYGSFGWFGIILFFFLTGLALNWAEKKFEEASKSPAIIAAYAGFYAMSMSLGRDSLFTIFGQYLLVWGVPLILARWLELRRLRI